jgi:hypothetical protein
MPLERNLEDKVVAWAEKMGGEAVKLIDDGGRGWPDRTIFLPNCEIIIPELKRPVKNKRYEQQKRRISFLQRLGFAADFVESMDELNKLYEEHYSR